MGKLKEFCERHAVLVTYAGIACVTLVTGAICYKIGVSTGRSRECKVWDNMCRSATREPSDGYYFKFYPEIGKQVMIFGEDQYRESINKILDSEMDEVIKKLTEKAELKGD